MQIEAALPGISTPPWRVTGRIGPAGNTHFTWPRKLAPSLIVERVWSLSPAWRGGESEGTTSLQLNMQGKAQQAMFGEVELASETGPTEAMQNYDRRCVFFGRFDYSRLAGKEACHGFMKEVSVSLLLRNGRLRFTRVPPKCFLPNVECV
jgi:hypothetical protein